MLIANCFLRCFFFGFFHFRMGNLEQPDAKIVIGVYAGNFSLQFKVDLGAATVAWRELLALQQRHFMADAVNGVEDAIDAGRANHLTGMELFF